MTTDFSPRPIVHRTRGHRRGPITRLMSPGDVGELVRPFIFLDLFEVESFQGRGFPAHPHSGIATLTTFLEGQMSYADSTGKNGTLTTGAVEWMRAGGGVWHSGSPTGGQPMRGYQLWVALPPQLELAPAESLYLRPEQLPTVGPARVLLGIYEGVSSPLPSPASMTYLHVRLQHQEHWTYRPATDHTVAWLALNRGTLHAGGVALQRELAVFAEGGQPIDMIAEGDVELVIGSAAKHPHPLICGYYSVHTSASALAEGENNITMLERTSAVAALRAEEITA